MKLLKIETLNITFVAKILIMFCFMFDICFVGIPSIFSTRKIAVVYMCLRLITKTGKFKIVEKDEKTILRLLFWLISLLFYVFIVSLVNKNLQDEFSILPRLIFMIIYIGIGIFYFVREYSTVSSFIDDVIITLLVQAVIVYFEFISMPFKIFLSSVVSNVGNVDFLRTDRAAGLGAEAGYLTLLFFMGVFSCNYLITIYGMKKKYFVYQIMLIIAMFAVGRTGLYASMIFIAVTYIYYFFEMGKIKEVLKIIFTCIILFIVSIYIAKSVISEEQFNRFAIRFTSGLFNFSEDKSVVDIKNMVIPPLNIYTVIGSGVYRGLLPSGFFARHDGGFIQAYTAFGIVGSFIYYGSIIITYIKLSKKIYFEKNIQTLLVNTYFIILLICEYKEPFIIKVVNLIFIYSLIILYNKENKFSLNLYYKKK